MKSRNFVAGTAVLGVLALVSLVATVLGEDGLADASRTVLIAVVGMLALAGLLSQRRIGRRVEHLYRRDSGSPRAEESVSPAVGQDDLVGMLRLVQAQYVGRLDRALSTLEQATEHLSPGAQGSAPQTAPALTVQPRDEHAPVVEAAIRAGIDVVVESVGTDEAQRWVERGGWQGRVVVADSRHDGATTAPQPLQP